MSNTRKTLYGIAGFYLLGLVLLAVVKRAGPVDVDKHWPGTEDGLAMMKRLCRL